MDYSVGSLADLISGSNTPNKPKVVQKKVKSKAKKLVEKPDEKIKSVKRGNVEKSDNAVVKKKFKKEKKARKEAEKESNNEENLTDLDEMDSKRDDSDVEDGVNAETSTISSEEKELREKQRNERTVFVGNLPVATQKKHLFKLFRECGKIEAVRIRNIAVSNPRIPKKIAIIKKKLHEKRTSVNAYVRFVKVEEALEALKLNGTHFNGHHIRVNLSKSEEQPDKNKAIFLGNVSFECEEEELWKLFESCGAIESVRLIRDSKTNVGKGFGYVNFKSADSVELALQMENVTLRNRELRISACHEKKKKNKMVQSSKRSKEKINKIDKKTNNDNFYQGSKVSEKKKKKFSKENVQKKKLMKKVAPMAKS